MSTRTTMPTTMRGYFQMGTTLANKYGLGQRVREKFHQAARRSVQIRIAKPIPQVERYVEDWFTKYVEGKLKPGAVEEDAFTIFLDPGTNQVNIVEPWQVREPTVTFVIWGQVAWQLAARVQTVYTAWMLGWPVYVDGEYAMRDIELVDEILTIYYELMLKSGHDLAALFREV